MKKILKSLILVFLFMFAFAVVANADETELDETNVQENVQEEKIEGKVEEEKTIEAVVTPVAEETVNEVANDVEAPKEEVKEVPVVKAKAVTHYLNIKYVKDITNPDNSVSSTTVDTKSYGKMTKRTTDTYGIIGLKSNGETGLTSRGDTDYEETDCDNIGKDCLFTFVGYYDDDGNKLVFNSTAHTGVSSGNSYLVTIFNNTALSISVGTLPEDINIKLHARFTKTYTDPQVDPELKISFYDTRTKPAGDFKFDRTFENDTITETVNTYQSINLANAQATYYETTNTEAGTTTRYTFLGWYTEGNVLIESGSFVSGLPTGVKIKQSANGISSLYVQTDGLTKREEIKLYAKWDEETFDIPELTINFYDTRTNASGDKVSSRKYENNKEIESIYTHQNVGLANAEATYFDETRPDGSIYRYTFLGWYTEDGTLITSDNFASGLPSGVNLRRKSDSEISALYLKTENIVGKNEINLYDKWSEELHYYPYKLTINYVDAKDNTETTVDTREYEKNTTKDVERLYSLLGMKSEADDYVDEKNDQNQLTGYRYFFKGWYTESGEQLTFEDYASLTPANIKLAYDSINPSSLYINVADLNENATIKLIARWEKEEVGLPNDTTLTIKYYDTRINSNGDLVKTDTYKDATVKSPYQTHSYLGLPSPVIDFIKDGDYKYIFTGWYTESGEKIVYETYNTSIPGLKIKKYSNNQSTALDIRVVNLEEDKEISLYAKWKKVRSDVKVTVHLYDDKHDLHGVEIVYDSGSDNDGENTGGTINSGSMPAIYKVINNSLGQVVLDLNKIFTADHQNALISKDDYQTINRDTLKIHVNNSPVIYTFKNWLDSEGNIISNGNGYRVPTEDSKVIERFEIVDAVDPSSGAIIKKQLIIVIKGIEDMDISEDTTNVDVNISVDWDEYTTAILDHQYIDEVSTGSGSWNNPNGGTVEYSHKYKEPSSPTHYEFQYWKYETPNPEDDQIDPNKEYKDQDVFYYDLFYKPDKWVGSAISHAYWKADVTLKLYDGTKLLGSKTDMDSVSISDILSEEPSKTGYIFLGWLDENNNKVTEETFYGEGPVVKPEPKTIELHADWKQIMVEVTVSKDWSDNNNNDRIRPDSVTVNLMNGKTIVDTATLSDENKWNYTFVAPMYNGEDEVNYTVSEDDVDGYTPEITGSMKEGFKILNVHENEQVEITVTKEWSDNNNNDGIRPDSVTVNLMNGETKVDSVTLSDENNWTYTFSADMKLNGTIIEYTISEDDVDGYTPEITGSMKEGFNILNIHENEQVKIAVTKEWDDNYDEDEIRPASVTVNLMNGETVVDSVTLSDENNWTHKFIADKKINGTTIEYTVSEDEVEFYEPIITGSDEEGFKIKNYHEPWPKGDGDEDEPTPEPEVEPEEPSNNPKTGDNIIINIIMLIVSMLGLASATLYVKKYNN